MRDYNDERWDNKKKIKRDFKSWKIHLKQSFLDWLNSRFETLEEKIKELEDIAITKRVMMMIYRAISNDLAYRYLGSQKRSDRGEKKY